MLQYGPDFLGLKMISVETLKELQGWMDGLGKRHKRWDQDAGKKYGSHLFIVREGCLHNDGLSSNNIFLSQRLPGEV